MLCSHQNSQRSTPGVKLDGPGRALPARELLPRIDNPLGVGAGWRHEFFGNDDLSSQFAVGGLPFTTDPGIRERNSFFVDVDFEHQFTDTVASYLRMEGDWSTGGKNYVFTGGLSFRW